MAVHFSYVLKDGKLFRKAYTCGFDMFRPQGLDSLVEDMTRKHHNHTMQTNQQLREEQTPQDSRKTKITVKQPALSSLAGWLQN